ncbi:MAG: hypothetical protein AAF378_09965 [Cyanobacteria bacterium P01_A01_bin.84]
MMLYMSPSLDSSIALPGKNKKDNTTVFPQVSGLNLQGKKFNLPGDFSAPYNVVLLAYSQGQQSDVNTWLPLLKQAETNLSELRYYELPTLPQMNPAARAQLDQWMIDGIPDEENRARTITLYLDVKAFNDVLNIDNTEEIQILLVTKEGKILWQEQGSFSASKGEALQTRLNELTQKTSLKSL